MQTRSARQYSLPKAVSNTTAHLVTQFSNDNINGTSHSTHSVPTTTKIPAVHDLLEVRTDLESMLPTVESRIEELEADLTSLEQIQEEGGGEAIEDHEYMATPDTAHSSENNVSKREDLEDDIFDPSHIVDNGESSRQAALEMIRKRRKRGDVEGSTADIKNTAATDVQYELSRHPTKLKKSNGIQLSPSTSPPPPYTTEATPEAVVQSTATTTSSTTNASTPLPLTSTNKTDNAKTTHTRLRINHAQAQKRQQQHQVEPQQTEEDVIPTKPAHQIPITTFYTHIDPYFRTLSEEDRDFLKQKTEDYKYYLIPPLGRHYSEKWAEEDQELGITTTESASALPAPRKNGHKNGHDRSHPNNHNNSSSSYDDYNMGHLTKEKEEGRGEEDAFMVGSLADRLIASLVKESILSSDDEYDDENDADDEDDEDEIDKNEVEADNDKVLTTDILNRYQPLSLLEMTTDPTIEILEFEERLKRELQYAGLLTEDDVDLNAKEDDEICAELRKLGREYKEQVKTNESRKKKLLEVVDFQLQYEQYRQVLDNLDSQVEQGYIKRCRLIKNRKRRSTGPRAAVSENIVSAMEKRKTWVNALGIIFKDKDMTMPQQSIYGDVDVDTTTAK